MKLPPPAVALKVDGSTLTGELSRDLVAPAGSRVVLRRVRDDARESCGGDYVLVFVASKPSSLEADRQAADEAWHRRDPRDEVAP